MIAGMRDFRILVHGIIALARLASPGGLRSVVGEAGLVNIYAARVGTGAIHPDVACIQRNRSGYRAPVFRGTAGHIPCFDADARTGPQL
jgi:hypothetical protein